MGQEAVNEQLLPVEPVKGVRGREYIFEPDRESLLDRISDLYVDNVVYEALLQARTGEHFARMTAMTTATSRVSTPTTARIRMGRTEKEVMPSKASFSIFGRVYLLSPASRSLRA